MFSAAILTLAIVLIGLLFKKWARTLYLSSKIPGPPAYPLVGNGLMYYKKQPHGTFNFKPG